MLVFRGRSRGAAVLSLLMGLVIMFLLYGMYLGPGPGGGAGATAVPWMLQQTDRTRSVVCDTNRRNALTQLYSDQIMLGHHLSPQQMAQTAAKLPGRCPGEGRLFVEGQEIQCTAHVVPPKFRQRFGMT